MAITNSGMVLLTANDTTAEESNWTGENGLDTYNRCIDGAPQNAISWNVAKNATETATYSTGTTDDWTSGGTQTVKYLIMWMASDLSAYYTSISLDHNSTSNTASWTLANSTNKNIRGEFHPNVVQSATGTGTFTPSATTSLDVIVNNSSSGNIRAVVNNWIDNIWYGEGRVITGTTANDSLFDETVSYDETQNRFDGCSERDLGGISFLTDIKFNQTTGISRFESVRFRKQTNTDGTITLSGTGDLQLYNSYLIADDDITLTLSFASLSNLVIKDTTIKGIAQNAGWKVGGTYEGSTFNTIASQFLNNTNITFTDCKFINHAAFTVFGTSTTFTNCDLIEHDGSSLVNFYFEKRDTFLNKFSGGSIEGNQAAVGVYVLEAFTADTTFNWTTETTNFSADTASTGHTGQALSLSPNSGVTVTIKNFASTVPTINNRGAGTVTIINNPSTLTIKNIVVGSRVYIAGYVNDVATTSQYVVEYGWTVDTNVTLRVRNSTSAPYYQNYEQIVTLVNGDTEITINQILDT